MMIIIGKFLLCYAVTVVIHYIGFSMGFRAGYTRGKADAWREAGEIAEKERRQRLSVKH